LLQLRLIAINLMLVVAQRALVAVDALLLLVDRVLAAALADVLVELVLVAAELALLLVVRILVAVQLGLVAADALVLRVRGAARGLRRLRRLGQGRGLDWRREGDAEDGEEDELAELHDDGVWLRKVCY
jgi:hypothetical protein